MINLSNGNGKDQSQIKECTNSGDSDYFDVGNIVLKANLYVTEHLTEVS